MHYPSYRDLLTINNHEIESLWGVWAQCLTIKGGYGRGGIEPVWWGGVQTRRRGRASQVAVLTSFPSLLAPSCLSLLPVPGYSVTLCL